MAGILTFIKNRPGFIGLGIVLGTYLIWVAVTVVLAVTIHTPEMEYWGQVAVFSLAFLGIIGIATGAVKALIASF